MRTELSEEIPVHRYAVFAEMAWLQRRPELGAICRMARDSGGGITASLVQQALPGLTDVAAANVIRRCRELDLCDRSGSLKGLGEEVAESDLAPIPEQGVYDVWVVDHPLLGRRILHAERLAPNPRDRHNDAATPTPIAIQPERNKVFTSVVDPHSKYLLRSFPSNNNEVGTVDLRTRARCRVRWTLDWIREDNEIRLDGFIDTATGQSAITHVPERAEIQLWQLMEHWRLGPLSLHGTWSTDARRLAVTYEGVSADELERFTRTLDLEQVEVPGFGRWSDAQLSDVPIGPATASDAQLWAAARLDRHLRENGISYTRTDVRNMFADTTENTPLAPFRPTLPEHDVLLMRHQDDHALYWQLAAPVDLAPHAPSRQELGPLRIGDDASTEPVASLDDAVVRVRPEERWSMKLLVDRLTGHEQPRRLLLVDRYVRGVRNLDSLRLLVAALSRPDETILDVWTGDDIADDTRAQIRAITGSAPRRYRDTFGQSGQPHDRYLVVVPEHGAPFGWQMTNSPLDARIRNDTEPSPLTPLRWRDLAAFRLPVEQLPDRLAAWANGGVR